MLIDGISDVTLANGVVRIQLNTVNPDGTDAKVGTIRNEFAIDIQENSVHGSDSDENAKIEIAFFFSDMEIIQNK